MALCLAPIREAQKKRVHQGYYGSVTSFPPKASEPTAEGKEGHSGMGGLSYYPLSSAFSNCIAHHSSIIWRTTSPLPIPFCAARSSMSCFCAGRIK